MSGMAQLSMYVDSTNALKKLTPLMEDLAVYLYGTNVSAEQLTSVAKTMGKAIQGNTTQLERMGVVLMIMKDNY